MTKVFLRDGESQQQLSRRFFKAVMRSGKLRQVRNKRWFIPKSEQKRIDKKKALRRVKQQMRKRDLRNNRYR